MLGLFGRDSFNHLDVMLKVNKMTKHKESKIKAEEELTSITVYVCAAGLGVIGYFVG